jgi:hypothetical protein
VNHDHPFDGENQIVNVKGKMTAIYRNQQKMSLAWWRVIFLCGIVFTGGCKKVYITEAEMDQKIRAEIPPGSMYAQITDFLKKYNWTGDYVSELSEFEDFGTLDSLLTEEEKRTIKWRSEGGKREAEKTLFGGKTIQIAFYYDEKGKLVTYKLHSYRI